MEQKKFEIVGKKVILKVHNRICENPEELVRSDLFREIIKRSINELIKRKSFLADLFLEEELLENKVSLIIESFSYLINMPIEVLPNLVPNSKILVESKEKLFRYVEFLYDYWRQFDRFIICNSEGDSLDRRPYRTFNETVETLTHVVRQTYRELQENIIHKHPNTFRQVRAGAGFAVIALPKKLELPQKYFEAVADIGIIRQVLLNPPLVLSPPMNKRTGAFKRYEKSPFDLIPKEMLNKEEWLCYPAKVGPMVILIYIHQFFYELGLSMVNLFEIASDEDLKHAPRGIYFFGVPDPALIPLGENATAFYEDIENNLFVAAVPGRPEFGYFGYLKKMVLTLHNCAMMRKGRLPFHGSLTRIIIDGKIDKVVLLIGDTGAGKSETLAAFQELGAGMISDIVPIADDMGSLDIDEEGNVIGYGTEIGAFLRLDDLKPGSAFAQLDRAIFMSVNQVNARVIVPIEQYYEVIKGYKIDYVLYANNYDEVNEEKPIVDQFKNTEEALNTFREGVVMSKGTTTSKGIVKSYFANIFGPPEYVELHDSLAKKFFDQMFKANVFVGQLRTRLGIPGFEMEGPEIAAKALIEMLKNQ